MARPLDADARRGEILDRAFVLFADQGYHALSMRDLARELGATTGTLYHWFAGKPELFAAMLARQVQRQVLAAMQALQDSEGDARMEALGRFIAGEADDLQRTLAVSVDFHREHPEGATPLNEALAMYRSALARGLGISENAARIVVSVVVGELLQRALEPRRDLKVLARLLPQIAHCASEADR